ncbi:MAG: hypothetical protein GQ582_12840 [Methyloprofundus sp.]|nr:hypothetical protein [Methyloprofundus sp.]
MLEFIIIVAIIFAVWFFRFRDKSNATPVEAVVQPKKDEPKAKKVEAKSAAPATNSKPAPAPVVAVKKPVAVSGVPEDASLKRHYLQNQAALAEAAKSVPQESPAVAEPMSEKPAPELESSEPSVPEDSMLKRHHQQLHDSVVDHDAELLIAALEDDANEPAVVEMQTPANTSCIPEDATLKRHFIQQLTAEIAAEMPACPTDSSLKRHYETQLMNAVDEQLQALA